VAYTEYNVPLCLAYGRRLPGPPYFSAVLKKKLFLSNWRPRLLVPGRSMVPTRHVSFCLVQNPSSLRGISFFCFILDAEGPAQIQSFRPKVSPRGRLRIKPPIPRGSKKRPGESRPLLAYAESLHFVTTTDPFRFLPDRIFYKIELSCVCASHVPGRHCDSLRLIGIERSQ